MLDYVRGRPSVSWRRKEVYAVIMFCLWCITSSDPRGPRLLWIRRMNRIFQRFTPWQIFMSTATAIYAVRHLDKLVGLHAPDPPAHLYSPAYYRATWLTMGLDAGFATAMSIRPKWLRDLCSVIFSVYYFLHGDEADEKIRKYREVCTVDMLRATWDKTSNPYIRAFTFLHRPRISVRRKILLERPPQSQYKRPVTAWLFFAPPADQLCHASDLVLDFPGGGFVAMGPEHHEERLRAWAVRTGRPVLSVDYSKAPEYPYPYAIDEGFDVYCNLVESNGRTLGMSGSPINIIMSGDSAGGNIAVNVMFKILESSSLIPHPAGLALTYAALNFALTSWSWPRDPNALLSEHENGDGAAHTSAMRTSPTCYPELLSPVVGPRDQSSRSVPSATGHGGEHWVKGGPLKREKSLLLPAGAYPRTNASLFEKQQEDMARLGGASSHADTECHGAARSRLTMSSRAGYLNDRIISPSMMWAMAIMYLGPRWDASLEGDYHISPILAPRALLGQFPPLLMQCGGKDPLVDDTMIFGGRVREAKLLHRKGTVAGLGDDETNKAKSAAAMGEEAGVHMQIFPDWSHGYLQMPSIMGDAKAAIMDIADWMVDTFQARGGHGRGYELEDVGAHGCDLSSGVYGNGSRKGKESLRVRLAGDVGGGGEVGDMEDVISFTVKKRINKQ